MKQKTKQNRNVMYELEGAVTGLFVILMVGFFPLFFQDGYFNITDAKLLFFYFCGAGLVVLTIILAGAGYLQVRKDNKIGRKDTGGAKRDYKEIIKDIPVVSWFTGGLLLTVLISTVCSAYPSESFYGTDGRRLGAIVFLLCMAVYLILGKYLQPGIWIAWIFLISNGLVSLVMILQFWGINVFHMWDNMVSTDIGMFASTIGNVNACCTYFCIVLPVAMVLFYLSDALLSKALYGVVLVLGFYGAYATTSDSWILGVGTAFLVLLCFSFRSHDSLKRFFETCMVFWASSLLLKITLLAGAGNVEAVMLQTFRALPMQNFMINKFVLLAEGIVLLLGIFLMKRAEKKKLEIPYQKIRRIFVFLVVLVIGIVALLVLIANLSTNKQWEGTFQWMNRLALQDDFGSSRGVIWKQTWNAWKKLPVGRKFFGYGLNCFYQFLYQYQGAELSGYAGRIIDPHNEALLFLSISGIFGAVCYFGFLISNAVSAGRMSRQYPIMMIGTVAICSYLAQSMVNNPTAFLTPTLFLYLGILKSLKRHYKEKEI